MILQVVSSSTSVLTDVPSDREAPSHVENGRAKKLEGAGALNCHLKESHLPLRNIPSRYGVKKLLSAMWRLRGSGVYL